MFGLTSPSLTPIVFKWPTPIWCCVAIFLALKEAHRTQEVNETYKSQEASKTCKTYRAQPPVSHKQQSLLGREETLTCRPACKSSRERQERSFPELSPMPRWGLRWRCCFCFTNCEVPARMRNILMVPGI